MATCLPSRASTAWGIFHLFLKTSSIGVHSSGVMGQVMTSSLYSSTMAWQTSGMMRLTVSLPHEDVHEAGGTYHLKPGTPQWWPASSLEVALSSSCILLLYPWPHSLHQLIKHGRLHPEVVEEGLWIFYSELLQQSGVMSIQPPPLLWQPRSGLISSGSSPPDVSSPGLLHISFKQVLLEDSNLEQSNMVQGVHTLWWLGWDWWKMLHSAAFYTLSRTFRRHSWYTRDIRVTF